MDFYSLQSEYYTPPPQTDGHNRGIGIKSEIPTDKRIMDPPPCVQNAMMTKDKKPFTYTPGGIDLSEIRSPRMARRIERNANYEGVTEVPSTSTIPPQNLPPSTLAAMNPQIQVQVLPSIPPPAPPPPMGGLNRQQQGGAPPPPPPPPPLAPLPTQKVNNNATNQVIERPDMTKIIPDNPMALLKKTGGPNQRTTFIDEMYKSGTIQTPPINQQINRQPDFQQPSVQQIQTKQPQQQSVPINQAIEKQNIAPFNLGSLYIPPINQMNSPPIPPERQENIRIQSPGTPTLKESPKPWQNKQQQQEIPPWVRRDEAPISPSINQNNGQNFNQQVNQPINNNNGSPIHIEVRSKQKQQQQQHPNAVFVTQPLVFQHPGPLIGPPGGGPQQQQRKSPNPSPSMSGGTRIIPIMIERGGNSSSGGGSSPNPDRFQRQQSWNNNPIQSNSFKVIQKLTQTDENVENLPKYPQTFQQQQQSDGQEHFLHNETDPRYRGAAIPSKAFKILQNMNDNSGINNVIQSQPQVRTIPIQIEDNQQPQKYIHPSQQITPEPKKYMGSSIPSRSFKMLQAMTAPSDVCANTSVNVENVTTPNKQWTYDHFIPPSPIPFYPEYFYYHPLTSPTTSDNYNHTQTNNNNNKDDNLNKNNNMYIPYWPPYYYPSPQIIENINNNDNNEQQQTYLPYCDPYYYYYYNYYYGYQPQMYSTTFSNNSDIEDINGYSSTDEMLYYTKQYNNHNNNNVDKIIIPSQEQINNENKDCKNVPENESDRNEDTDNTMVEDNDDDDSSDENETIINNENKKTNNNQLQSLASVTDIKIYDSENDDDDDGSDTTTIEKKEKNSTPLNINEDDDDDDDEESIYSIECPHQLSVIMEETEHSSSVCNDEENTTITDSSSSDDDEEINISVNLKLPNIVQQNCDDSDSNTSSNESVVHATFTINNIPSTTTTKLPHINESKAETTNLQPIPINSDTKIQNNDEETSDSDESCDENEENWWSIVKEPIQQHDIAYKKFMKPKTVEKNDLNNNENKQVELMSIKDRIKILKESIEIKEKQLKAKKQARKIIPEPIILIDEQPSEEDDDEEEEEEENDSGVTSDVSRHISDGEDFQELQKFNRYQRAATHSRLFQLLQEIGDSEDDGQILEKDEKKQQQDKFNKLSVRQQQTNNTQNRQHLTLPLTNINEPSPSPSSINDKLVNELIVSLLHSKKGQIFRNISKEKLKCTAIRVLQEDLDDLETPSSSSGYNSLLSPPRGSTECSSPAQTPQDFYENTSYSEYYDTWNEQQQHNNNNINENEHLIPSKAFKIIQEQINNNNNTNHKSIKSSPKCPRVGGKKNKSFINQKQSFNPDVAEVTNNNNK